MNARGFARLLIMLAIAGGASSAGAQAVITVDTTSTAGTTTGNCELNEAVLAAETNAAVDGCAAGSAAGPDKIVFAKALDGQTISYSSAPTFNSGEVVLDAQFRTIVLQATGTADALDVFGANVTLRGIDARASTSGNGVTLVAGNLTVNNSSLQGRLGMNAFGSSSVVTINNSTVSSTETSAASDIAIRAGSSTSLVINNSTIVASVGKGIDMSSSSGTANVYSSIIVGATPVSGASTNSGGTLLATSTANAGLAAAVANNGGTTRTFALLSGAAIDGGSCAAATFPRYDQRYYFNGTSGTRAVGAACDAGAFESGAQDLLSDRLFTDGFEL
jgi:hypothetical protein